MVFIVVNNKIKIKVSNRNNPVLYFFLYDCSLYFPTANFVKLLSCVYVELLLSLFLINNIYKSHLQMLMMCGLPGCGKTVWANKWASENPDKCYNILGTNNLIDRMKVCSSS